MYPVKEVILPAVWKDTVESIHAVTDVFGFRYFVMLKSGLLITAAPVHADVEHAVDISDGILICGDATSQKSSVLVIDNAQVLLDTVIDTGLEKTAASSSGISISANLHCTDLKYRKIAELEGLTFADIGTWALKDIYYMEV